MSKEEKSPEWATMSVEEMAKEKKAVVNTEPENVVTKGYFKGTAVSLMNITSSILNSLKRPQTNSQKATQYGLTIMVEELED